MQVRMTGELPTGLTTRIFCKQLIIKDLRTADYSSAVAAVSPNMLNGPEPAAFYVSKTGSRRENVDQNDT